MERLFDKTNPRKNRKITFFKKEIFIEMGGKKIDLRKMIHKNAEDTGIYEQIEKYGLNPIEKIDIDETVMDFTQIAGDLRSVIERGQLAREMFKRLPIEVRKEFNNDENLFMREGDAWMTKKHQEILEKQKAQQPAQPIQPKQGE